MKCKFCDSDCRKAGRQKNGAQKLCCKACGKYQQLSYRNNACKKEVQVMIPQLVCESVSIRGIARVLKIAARTVVNGIRRIARGIKKPPIIMNQAAFEVDELYTYVGNKQNQYWVAYAINRTSGDVIDFIIGKRTKRTLRVLINTLLLSGVKRIYTDNLNIYRTLIPGSVHHCKAYCTNHIERKNRSIRTHLKRLSRRTICFSRSYSLLESCMRIYFWSKMHSNEC